MTMPGTKMQSCVSVDVLKISVSSKSHGNFYCWQVALNARKMEWSFLVTHSLVDVAPVLHE